MKRGHAVLVSLIVAAAAIVGIAAASHTVGLGRAARPAALSSAQIAARSRALDRTEAALRRMLRRSSTAPARATPVRPERVIYVRPAPHVVTLHPHGDEHEAGDEGRDEGELDD
ncbi:MAG TPA: hypothetical protein VH816_11855 [Gaiellaceae bacterium]|jgi:hypothetical protein